MADTKITGLNAITSRDDADWLVVVDTSDTTMGASGSNKKILVSDFVDGLSGGGGGGIESVVEDTAPELGGNLDINGNTITGYTASRALQTDGSGNVEPSLVTSTELGYLDGVTSGIQTQLNGKSASDHSHTKLDYITITQAVDLDTIESRVNALDAAVVLKDSWDASAGTFPGGGTAQAGDSYIVSTGGTVDEVEFTANDRIVAITDNAATDTYAANWLKLDYTDAVLSVAGKTGAVSLDSGDVGLGSVENTALSTWAGTSNITTVGTIGTGTWQGDAIAHEYGGLETDISAVTTGDIIVGTGAGTVGLLNVGTDGYVLTAQADGSVAWEAASGGGGGGTVQGTDGTYDIQPANEGATAGNARGENSVDLQTLRYDAAKVASGTASTVSGGYHNEASGDWSTVGGGGANTASAGKSTVSGGFGNTASAGYSTVSGGFGNTASGYWSIVSGRYASDNGNDGCFVFCDSTTNSAYGPSTANTAYFKVVGGFQIVDGNQSNGYVLKCDANGVGTWQVGNGTVQGTDGTYDIRAANEGALAGSARGENSVDLQTLRYDVAKVASGAASTVSGGYHNEASGEYSAVGGGGANMASAYWSTVSGGYSNIASGYQSTVSGGFANEASGEYSAVGGGGSNTASSTWSTVSGGFDNTASGDWSTVGGGRGNTASGGYPSYSTVSGGYINTASGYWSTVGGGMGNTASGESSTVSGGQDNTASAGHSTVSGGAANEASGEYSTIAGGIFGVADKYGQQAYASGRLANDGDAQSSKFVVRKSVTHSTTAWSELFLDGNSERMTIAASTAWLVDAKIIGITADAAKRFAFRIQGLIDRDASNNTTFTQIDKTSENSDDVSFDARLAADDTNEALKVEVQDSDGGSDTVRWVAVIETVEVSYPS